jgi:hypothetical protein
LARAIGVYLGLMNSLRNPAFIAPALLVIVGLVALSINAMVGAVLVVIALLLGIAGYILNARRTNRGDPAAGVIRLQTPPR